MRRPHEVIFTEPAKRVFRKLPQDIQGRILRKTDELAENPWPPGVTKLSGYDAIRVRVGDRIIYKIEYAKLLVLILDVGHRREIYRDL